MRELIQYIRQRKIRRVAESEACFQLPAISRWYSKVGQPSARNFILNVAASSWQGINLPNYAVFSGRTTVKEEVAIVVYYAIAPGGRRHTPYSNSPLTLATLMQINTKQSTATRSFNPPPKKRYNSVPLFYSLSSLLLDLSWNCDAREYRVSNAVISLKHGSRPLPCFRVG